MPLDFFFHVHVLVRVNKYFTNAGTNPNEGFKWGNVYIYFFYYFVSFTRVVQEYPKNKQNDKELHNTTQKKKSPSRKLFK